MNIVSRIFSTSRIPSSPPPKKGKKRKKKKRATITSHSDFFWCLPVVRYFSNRCVFFLIAGCFLRRHTITCDFNRESSRQLPHLFTLFHTSKTNKKKKNHEIKVCGYTVSVVVSERVAAKTAPCCLRTVLHQDKTVHPYVGFTSRPRQQHSTRSRQTTSLSRCLNPHPMTPLLRPNACHGTRHNRPPPRASSSRHARVIHQAHSTHSDTAVHSMTKQMRAPYYMAQKYTSRGRATSRPASITSIGAVAKHCPSTSPQGPHSTCKTHAPVSAPPLPPPTPPPTLSTDEYATFGYAWDVPHVVHGVYRSREATQKGKKVRGINSRRYHPRVTQAGPAKPGIPILITCGVETRVQLSTNYGKPRHE